MGDDDGPVPQELGVGDDDDASAAAVRSRRSCCVG